MKPFEWVNPTSQRQVVDQLVEGRGTAEIKAGGIDLVDRMRLGISAPLRVINLGALPQLRYIRADLHGLRIGATTTLAQIAAESLLLPRYAAIAEAAAGAASAQIRNVATVAGNLLQRPRCWYFRHPELSCLKKGGTSCPAEHGEHRYHAILGGGPSYMVHPSTMATALLACDARLRLLGPGPAPAAAGGSVEPVVTEVPLDGFFVLPAEDAGREHRLAPGQLVTEVIVPAAPNDTRSVYRAVKERQVYDWPLAEVVASVTLRGEVVERARVVLGALAPIPWRSREAEAALVGKRVTIALAAEAARAALAGARPLPHNRFKVPIAATLIERAILTAADRS